MKTLTKIAAVALLSVSAVGAQAQSVGNVAVMCGTIFMLKADALQAKEPDLAKKIREVNQATFIKITHRELGNGGLSASQGSEQFKLITRDFGPGGVNRAGLDTVFDNCLESIASKFRI